MILSKARWLHLGGGGLANIRSNPTQYEKVDENSILCTGIIHEEPETRRPRNRGVDPNHSPTNRQGFRHPISKQNTRIRRVWRCLETSALVGLGSDAHHPLDRSDRYTGSIDPEDITDTEFQQTLHLFYGQRLPDDGRKQSWYMYREEPSVVVDPRVAHEPLCLPGLFVGMGGISRSLSGLFMGY